MNESTCGFEADFLQVNFSDISDGEIMTATQLIESNSGILSPLRNTQFSDISDNELIQASAVTVAAMDNKSDACDELVKLEFSDISDDELIRPVVDNESTKPKNRFKPPVSCDEMANIIGEKFAKKTIDKSTWAVTLFGQWRAERNVRCLSDESLLYLDKPFGLMTDDELHYTVPLFLTEVLKEDGSEYPPATLRDIVLSLQKFLEVQGRNVKFLSDKFRNIRDTVDGLMKQRSRQGLGFKKKQAEASNF